MEVTEAQIELLEIVLEVRRADQRLHLLAQRLPRPENQDEMFEGKIPSDVASEIYGAIDFIRATELKNAIDGLEAATKITAEELKQRFAKAREKDGLDLLAANDTTADRETPGKEHSEKEQIDGDEVAPEAKG